MKDRNKVVKMVIIITIVCVLVILGAAIGLKYTSLGEKIESKISGSNTEDTIILVVGGSTTEMMLMSHGKMAAVHSLRLGTVRIDQHIKNQVSSYDDIQRFVKESVTNTKGSLENELNLSQIKRFIAVGQDVTLAALNKGHPISTFLWEIGRDDFMSFLEEIQDYSIDECAGRFKKF